MSLLFRNWHLKLGAVALAMVLYTGLVYSGSFSEADALGVPVRAIGQPSCCVNIGPPLGTIDLHYRATRDTARPTVEAFSATVDLSKYDMQHIGEAQSLPVKVGSLIDGLTVLSYTRHQVSVTLDQVDTKTVPVVVDRGTVPQGFEISTPVATPAQAQVSGPRSRVSQVVRAMARVTIEASGLDVSRQVDLEPVDLSGQRVDGIEVSPRQASVSIAVRAVETSKTVPVRPVLQGTPATGYVVGVLSVDPPVVTVRGAPATLSGVTGVDTQPISVTGAARQLVATARLVVPKGTRLADGAPATVQISVPVTAATGTRTILVGLICRGAPSGSACLPLLDQIAVTLSGTQTALAALRGAAITPILDVTGLPPGQQNVQPTLSPPAGIQLVSISPASVPVQITPPKTPAPSPSR